MKQTARIWIRGGRCDFNEETSADGYGRGSQGGGQGLEVTKGTVSILRTTMEGWP